LARKSKKQQKQIEELIKGLLVMVALGSYLYTNSIAVTGFILGIVIVILIILAIMKAKMESEKLRKSGIQDIDKMDGIQFEYYLKELFKSQGYIVEVTKSTGDFGADLILKNHEKKIVVQAKRYSKNVGIKAVQEISAAMKYYNAHEGWVVSNSFFTKAATELASTVKVRLIDRKELIDSILKMNPNLIPNPQKVITQVKEKDLICVKCGSELILRNGAKGKFYGCSSFPKCRYIRPVSS
jgi:restriction system protein